MLNLARIETELNSLPRATIMQLAQYHPIASMLVTLACKGFIHKLSETGEQIVSILALDIAAAIRREEMADK
jgi:hypothetical protein